MLVTIDTPYADTTAADLSFALGLPPQPALHVLDLEFGGVTLHLRLLGASHQVLCRSGPAVTLSETVACLPGRPPALPATVKEIGYRFEAHSLRLARAEFAVRVAGIRRAVAAAPTGLLGVFPGGPDAVTALVAYARPGGGAGWRTWHAYPQSGELVSTVTEVTPR